MEKLLQFKRNQWQFNITPEQHEVTITVKATQSCDIQESFKCQMKLFLVNINTSLTGYKLQRRSKDIDIMSSSPQLKNNICVRNLEYVMLSRVWTIKGLFLFRPINMEQPFKPTKELIQFMNWAERTENTLLQKRQVLGRKWSSTWQSRIYWMICSQYVVLLANAQNNQWNQAHYNILS